jgi:hypothetical protein
MHLLHQQSPCFEIPQVHTDLRENISKAILKRPTHLLIFIILGEGMIRNLVNSHQCAFCPADTSPGSEMKQKTTVKTENFNQSYFATITHPLI